MEEKQELFKKITNILSKQETDVFYLRIQGFTYKEIAALLNITPKAVDGCISKIKAKISNKLDEDVIK
jgi:RNA polymerase sigma factor (sigma-70 family)